MAKEVKENNNENLSNSTKSEKVKLGKEKDTAKKPVKAKTDTGKKKFSIKKYFKDSKSEFKKVVWPSRKQVINNTIVVLVCLVAASLFVWGVDTLFALVINKLLLQS